MSRITLAVAIPVYNEEHNIGSLLDCLLTQRASNFTLAGIRVYSDASTDSTHVIVRTLQQKHPKISLMVGKARKGKYMRMNQMFRDCTEDVLIVLDADIVPNGKHFLERLVALIQKDKRAMLASAHQVLLRPTTFVGRVLYADFALWDCVRLSLPTLQNPHNFYASASAFRGDFVRSFTIPTFLKDPHLFLYLMADRVGGYRYCMQAQIYQWPIATLQDYKKFLQRSLGKHDPALDRYLGVDTTAVYRVPTRAKWLGLLKALRREPFFTPLAVMLNLYFHKIRPLGRIDQTSVWQMAWSTKKKIRYA